MSARWVVMVKPPDDHPHMVRVFGYWRAKETAERFCEEIRAAVDAVDDTDEIVGYAYVAKLEGWHAREALAWAVNGE